ncbi:MAG: HAMP domain-containing histidine kinase [Ruminococcaceae bacterium]|nr:HAMP domain-containing histidine kinase [Oscillospiraceae bacterium]
MRQMKNKNRAEIKRSIFAYFIVFSLIIIAILWLCQTLLLDTFYYRNTLSGMKRVSSSLSEQYMYDNFSDTVESTALKSQYSIRVLRLSNGRVTTLATVETLGSSVHKLTNDQLGYIYEKAAENGNVYYTEVYLHNVFNPIFMREELSAYIPQFDGDMGESNPFSLGIADERLVLCRLVYDENGDALMLLLDSELSPVSSVVSTLRVQLSFISLIILLLSLLLAKWISGRISRPIVRLNDKAKRLADGGYGVDFSGDGYREICELGDTLNDASEKLSALDRMQKELIANISHDLRTPLTMIKGYAELMRDIDSENTPENMQVIIDETERLNELVADIMQISKVQSESESVTLEVFDLSQSINEIIERYRRLKHSEGFDFELHIADSSVIKADKGKILQVICNLLNNAINYTRNGKVIINCFNSDGFVHVDIIDRGEGIPAEELPNIWQRYYKVDKTHTRSRVGSGLGLSIVRGILELHHARYGVQSTLGDGSRFWFELPLFKSL